MTTKKKLPANHPQRKSVKRKPRAPKPAPASPYAPSTEYFADLCGVPYSRTDEYPTYWVDDLTIERPAPWRVWVSRKLTALAQWVAP
jgi:hypothetical protein